jgi:PBSX family phage terminase large subunit
MASVVEVVEYDPLPVFDPFHTFAGREGALIGGYGSGKSVALCAELLKQALEQPGTEWLLARKTLNSLAITTEKTFLDMLPGEFLKASHVVKGGGHVQYIDLPTGSRIHFKGLDDWHKIKSLNLAGFFLDEADEIDEESYIGLKSRIRQVHPLKAAGLPRGTIIRSGIIRVAMNPNGHDFYWGHFIKDAERHDGGRLIGGGDRMAFLSTSLDNPYNPFSYLEDLLSMPEPWVRRYVFCSFEDFQGVIYPEWDWQTHVVKPYGYYDPSGLFFMGMDPGTQNPTAGVWCYVDHARGALVAVAEYIQPGVDVSTHVHSWRRIEAQGTHNTSRRPGRMRVSRRIADPSIATRDRGSMNSLESLYARHQFHFEHGPKNIPDRLPALGELIHGTPRFLVTEECEMLYEQIKQYRYEDLTPNQIEKGVEAKPLKKNVDLVDASQYIASRWISPAVTRPRRVQRSNVRIESEADKEILARIVEYESIGLMDEAAILRKELVPDGALEDARHGVVRRRAIKQRTEKSAGLA